jgi:argininosuccinate lyase
MARLWDKGLPLDERILRFTAGEDHRLDERLVEYDARASIAHARMLEQQKLLSTADCKAICDGLAALAAAHAAGEWSIELADEDAHSALERRLTQRIGEAGGRVHLGRSRNDQVLVALRLYLRDAIDSLASQTEQVVAALDRVAAEQGAVALPGYTHMQPAMPSSVALWAKGFGTELADDRAGLLRGAARS